MSNLDDNREHEKFIKFMSDAFRDLSSIAHNTSVKNGFWEPPIMMDKYAAKLMLITTEVAEITEALRKRHGAQKVTEEFSDMVIRALCLHKELVENGEATDNLFETLVDKMEKNDKRGVLHGHRWG